MESTVTHPPLTRNPLGYEKVEKLIVRFAVPAIISMVVNAVYNIVDQVFIGWSDIGMLGIGATTVSFPLTTIATSVSLLLAVGGASLFNLSLGRGEPEKAGSTAGNVMILSVFAGILLFAASLLLLSPMLTVFGATEANMPYAVSYTRIIIYGIPFQILGTVLSHLIRADGSPRYSMVCMLSGAVFNFIFDPVFLFVFDMGIEGIALATSLGMVLSTSIGAVYVMRRFKNVSLNRASFRLTFGNVKAIASLGMASFFNQIALTVMQIVLNNTLKTYGGLSVYGSDIPIACVGSVNKINTIFLSVIIGIGQGCQPINGFNYGAKNYGRVISTYLTAVISGTAVAVLTFLIYQLFPVPILKVFGNNSDGFYEFGERFLRIFMFMSFFNGVQPITANFFTSIGKARKGLFISLTRQIIILIPLLLILPRFMGIDGVLYAGPASDFAAGAVGLALVSTEIRQMRKLEKEKDSKHKENKK
jgi:putative MATE family efflux protein